MTKAEKKQSGFTLIELLVVISIIGFLLVATIVSLNIVQMESRDTVRAGNVTTIKKALDMYINEKAAYPASTGECLSSTAGTVGAVLIAQQYIASMPVDPLWPTTVPANPSGGLPADTDSKFCYYYFSDASVEPPSFYLSYYLETNSKTGDKGVNYLTPDAFHHK